MCVFADGVVSHPVAQAGLKLMLILLHLPKG